ncbi:hypothetical protein U1Q18_039616 [Sarracenia purpurea var. burkii]
MSRGGGSTGTTSSSSLVAKDLDTVNVTLPLFEGQRSPAKLNKEVKVGETMNHPRVSSSPMRPSSPAKISQVFSEALRQDREDVEGDDDSQEEIDIERDPMGVSHLSKLSVEATLPVEVLPEDITGGLVQGDSVSKKEIEIYLGPAKEEASSVVSLLPRSFGSSPDFEVGVDCTSLVHSLSSSPYGDSL